MSIAQHTPTNTELVADIRRHHAAMVADLDRLTDVLRAAPPYGQPSARAALSEWFEEVLLPHAHEEEHTTYAAAAALPEGRLLIGAMVREHAAIKRLVSLFTESTGAAAAAYGRAVYEVFDSHQRKENEIILPLLAAAEAPLAAVVTEAHGHQVGAHHH